MTLKQTKQIKLPTFTPGRCAPHPMPPLRYAVYNIYYAGVEPILALLAAGVELNAADEHGVTALHEAVYEKKPEVYALLVQAGADQHAPDWFGDTPAIRFEREFGMTYEEKFRGMTIDAAYFRKKLEGLHA